MLVDKQLMNSVCEDTTPVYPVIIEKVIHTFGKLLWTIWPFTCKFLIFQEQTVEYMCSENALVHNNTSLYGSAVQIKRTPLYLGKTCCA